MQIAANGLERLMAGSQEEVRGELAATERAARLNWLLGLSAVAIALVLAAFLATRLSRSLVRPARAARSGRPVAGGGTPGAPRGDQLLRRAAGAGETFNRWPRRSRTARAARAAGVHRLADRRREPRAVRAPPRARAGARGRRDPSGVAVLMIDLDDFKLVNDGLGHASGDDLLGWRPRRISDAARPSDTVARLGGDEFAVLLEGVRGLDDALAAAERLRRLFRDPFALDLARSSVSASIGIAMGPRARDAASCCAAPTSRCTGQGARQGRHGVLRSRDGGPRGRPARRRQRAAQRARARRAGRPLPADRRPRDRRRSSRPRRCCAGSGPATASCRRSTSSRSPRRPG